MSAVKVFEGVAFKIEADGSIRAVIDDESGSSTERRKFTVPSREPLAKSIDGLSKEGVGGGTEIEIDPQQSIHSDEGGHKDGLGSLSFREDNGVRSELGAPRFFFCLTDVSLRIFDGSFNHINLHVERNGELVDKSGTFFEIARVKLFESPQAL
jgi:hypothetical protein